MYIMYETSYKYFPLEDSNNNFIASGKLSKNSSTSRVNQRYSKNAPMTRSSSTSVLNQSDSENEGTEKKRQSRLMRPTISSQNKVANNKGLLNRKRQSHSTSNKMMVLNIFPLCLLYGVLLVNLSTVGQDDISTSDDEEKIKVTTRARPNPDLPIKRLQNGKEKLKGIFLMLL